MAMQTFITAIDYVEQAMPAIRTDERAQPSFFMIPPPAAFREVCAARRTQRAVALIAAQAPPQTPSAQSVAASRGQRLSPPPAAVVAWCGAFAKGRRLAEPGGMEADIARRLPQRARQDMPPDVLPLRRPTQTPQPSR